MIGITVKIEVKKGASIQNACDSAKVLSEYLKEEIEFTFNGVKITTQKHHPSKFASNG